jgi:LmbE family N-acetylglucosaminyl deacetylase
MRAEKRQKAVAHWCPFVQAFVEAYALGERLTGGLNHLSQDHEHLSVCRPPGDGGKGPLVLLCSPHPDDEALTGALPLRLLHEQGATVINLAVTLGSDPSRQAVRWAELAEACAVLGFGCRRLHTPTGFELKAGEQSKEWQSVVGSVAQLFEELGPDAVFFPHPEDHHPAHVATSRLVSAALALYTTIREQMVTAIETEYWRPMAAPNLLVGVSVEDVALLLAAVACHRGEIMRNPYHLTLPARLMDGVRRGGELVSSSTSARPDFLFGELYRVSLWKDGGNQPLANGHNWFGPDQDLNTLLP